MIERLWGEGRAVVAVTCGEDGVWYRARGDERVHLLPAFRVDVVDSTGCGDVFHGAYALGLARAMDVQARMRFAAAAAAIKATKPGGQAGIPDSATVAAFLGKR
jgi:sulfofructose kinase